MDMSYNKSNYNHNYKCGKSYSHYQYYLINTWNELMNYNQAMNIIYTVKIMLRLCILFQFIHVFWKIGKYPFQDDKMLEFYIK